MNLSNDRDGMSACESHGDDAFIEDRLRRQYVYASAAMQFGQHLVERKDAAHVGVTNGRDRQISVDSGLQPGCRSHNENGHAGARQALIEEPHVDALALHWLVADTTRQQISIAAYLDNVKAGFIHSPSPDTRSGVR